MIYSHAGIFQKWLKPAQLNILSLGVTMISMLHLLLVLKSKELHARAKSEWHFKFVFALELFFSSHESRKWKQ